MGHNILEIRRWVSGLEYHSYTFPLEVYYMTLIFTISQTVQNLGLLTAAQRFTQTSCDFPDAIIVALQKLFKTRYSSTWSKLFTLMLWPYHTPCVLCHSCFYVGKLNK